MQDFLQQLPRNLFLYIGAGKDLEPIHYLKKIPSINILRDFFANTGKYYLPSNRELGSKFCKDILAGRKKLLKSS